MTPDGYISAGISGPLVAIEVGLSQSFNKQVEKAEKWLLRGPARLVILVDVNIIKLGANNFSKSFAGSTYSTLGSQDTLPYGITKEELENPKVKEMGLKIFNWHEDKTALAKLKDVNLYLYRRKSGSRPAINRDAKFVVFEELNGFTSLEYVEAFITTDDLEIKAGNHEKKISLPLHPLKACFGQALTKEQLHVAEKNARQIMRSYGHDGNTSSFQPSSGVGEGPSYLQGGREESNRPQTRKMKRKLITTGDVSSDQDSSFGPTQSFQTTSSGIFQMDPLASLDAPQFSQRSSPILSAVDLQAPKVSLASFSSALGLESSTSQPWPKHLKRKKKT
jgi:hypothetical protein